MSYIMHIYIWAFRKIGVPPIHPIYRWIFPYKRSSIWRTGNDSSNFGYTMGLCANIYIYIYMIYGFRIIWFVYIPYTYSIIFIVDMYIHTYTYIHTCMHTYIHTYIHVCIHHVLILSCLYLRTCRSISKNITNSVGILGGIQKVFI